MNPNRHTVKHGESEESQSKSTGTISMVELSLEVFKEGKLAAKHLNK